MAVVCSVMDLSKVWPTLNTPTAVNKTNMEEAYMVACQGATTTETKDTDSLGEVWVPVVAASGASRPTEVAEVVEVCKAEAEHRAWA